MSTINCPYCAEEISRKEKIESQFSAWDGSHRILSSSVKSNLKDPKSYEHIETRFTEIKNEDGTYDIAVFMEYRAKNSFGGYVIGNVKAYFDLEGNPTKLSDWIES